MKKIWTRLMNLFNPWLIQFKDKQLNLKRSNKLMITLIYLLDKDFCFHKKINRKVLKVKNRNLPKRTNKAKECGSGKRLIGMIWPHWIDLNLVLKIALRLPWLNGKKKLMRLMALLKAMRRWKYQSLSSFQNGLERWKI